MIIANFMRVVSRYKTVRAPDTGFMVIGGKSEDKRQEERRGDLISKCEKSLSAHPMDRYFVVTEKISSSSPLIGHLAGYWPLIGQVRSKVCSEPDNLPLGVMSQL